MSKNNEYYWADDPELRDLIEERRKRNDQLIIENDAKQKEIDQILRKLDKIEIREKSITPTQDIISKYRDDVIEELNEHETRRARNPGMSSMWEIPLPNKSRRFMEEPYTLNTRPNEFARNERNNRTRKGGVKKRMTKKGKNKKKKKKQRRRTNKKRYKRKV